VGKAWLLQGCWGVCLPVPAQNAVYSSYPQGEDELDKRFWKMEKAV
jgi:hypothetical protein